MAPVGKQSQKPCGARRMSHLATEIDRKMAQPRQGHATLRRVKGSVALGNLRPRLPTIELHVEPDIGAADCMCWMVMTAAVLTKRPARKALAPPAT